MNARDLVGERYFDALGAERVVPLKTREAFINALASAEAPGFAAPTRVLREGEPLTIDITLPASAWQEIVLWTLRHARGDVKAGTVRLRDAPVVRFEQAAGTTLDTRHLTLPPRVLTGEYRLTLDIGTLGHAGIDVLVAPPQCYLPPDGERCWGLAVQLYALRSQHNWGIGDFTDLGLVCALAGDAGASLVGINPLHASHRSDPEAASPYAPTSRRFLNWLTIDVGAVPEAQTPAVQQYVESIRAEIDALRASETVDYTGVAALKGPTLRLCFASLGGARAEAFADFVQAEGEPLRRFAIYEALVARYGRNMQSWPEGVRRPDGADVAAFASADAAAVDFGMYLQWCAAEQLAAATATGRAHGVALYRDLAVGVETNSADVWIADDYVGVATVGAPPDLLNTRGQDWGLPPLSPTVLAADAFAGFAGLLADNMREAGALRIDHAMSLTRLFWIPRGGKPAEGAYVSYPFDDLLAILARESTRAKCIVIGEDLGTVPDGFRERMAASNVLSYRLLLFERERDGAFLPPEAYPALALAATGTHDLPPFPGWLAGSDIVIRERIGLLDAADARRERTNRDVDVGQLLHALDAWGDLGDDMDAETITLAAYRYLARSPARIVMLQLEDALGETTPVNIPGTNTEYANWRRKLRDELETVAADPRFVRFAETLRELRPRE